MNRFIEKYSGKLLGVISGFDRLVLKGTLRPLSYTAGMMNFLFEKEVLLKDFRCYVQQVSEELKEASQQEAVRLGRSNRYLESSHTRKEPLARKIAETEGIEVMRTHEGITLFSRCRQDAASSFGYALPEESPR
jgi:hypothetical protein